MHLINIGSSVRLRSFQSCRLSFWACLSFASKAYLVSCNCSMISLASFMSWASWLYFSVSSWFSLRSSTTSWLSSSLCRPQCSFSCSISPRVTSMRFTRPSSFSFDMLSSGSCRSGLQSGCVLVWCDSTNH